jgi:purine nucleosidase
MGGALRVPGNISPLAEFNFGIDAAAAALVVAAFSQKIKIFPLDGTMACLLTPADLLTLASVSGTVGKWFSEDLAPFYMKAYRQINSVDMPLHDAHTIAAIIRPDLYEGS